MKVSRIAALVMSILLIVVTVEATTIPVGVQTNVPATTVFNTWGWGVAWQSTYDTSNNPITTVFANVPAGSPVMLAAKPVGSDTFTLLAAALESDVRTYTPQNTTHTANGAEWYYNGGSMGFAGLGDTIYQSNADVNSANPELRLSWHTNDYPSASYDYSVPPTNVYYGWRAGTNTNLNLASDWERYVLVPVPEPTTLALAAMGLMAIFCRGRKRA